MTGTIKAVRDSRSFAFIRPDGATDSEGDHFAHIGDMPGKVLLPRGARVEFQSEMTERGLRARHIHLLLEVG